jgi:hypothetical protein
MTAPNIDDLINKISEENVYRENTREMNKARYIIVVGIFFIFFSTALLAGLAAFYGTSDQWKQLSPVIDTLLAGELAVLGSVIAFYMAK